MAGRGDGARARRITDDAGQPPPGRPDRAGLRYAGRSRRAVLRGRLNRNAQGGLGMDFTRRPRLARAIDERPQADCLPPDAAHILNEMKPPVILASLLRGDARQGGVGWVVARGDASGLIGLGLYVEGRVRVRL